MANIVAGDMYRELDGQLFEIKRQLRQPGGYPFNTETLKVELQQIIEGKFSSERRPPQPRSHIEILREKPKPCAKRTADEQVRGMEAMYKMLGWSFAVSGLVVPERRKGFDRLIAVGDPALTNNRAYDACDASFTSWRYADDLDTAVPSVRDERHPNKNGIYAVWFRDRVEADEELKNSSANMIAESGMKTITLLERELMELVYFMETGDHLDIQNWTLCSGSRNSDDDVPNAYWGGGRFRVDWSYRGDRDPNLRSREAVTL